MPADCPSQMPLTSATWGGVFTLVHHVTTVARQVPTACYDGRFNRRVHTGPPRRTTTQLIYFATLSCHWIWLLQHVPIATASSSTYRDVTRSSQFLQTAADRAGTAAGAGWSSGVQLEPTTVRRHRTAKNPALRSTAPHVAITAV